MNEMRGIGGRNLDLLLVEDDPGDVAMTREALAEAGHAIDLHVVTNGEDAIAYLRCEGPFEGASRPDLVLLDLNLPRLGGLEVLAQVKNDPRLLRIPVVVLTTSRSDSDILRSYDLHANAVVTKPVGYEKFMAAVQEIDHFFTATAALPPR